MQINLHKEMIFEKAVDNVYMAEKSARQTLKIVLF
jgi:hypothetical protein